MYKRQGAGDTGDGMQMALDVGGVFYNDPYVITLGSTSRNGSIAGFCMSVNLWGRMVVNSKAQRFFNEGYMPYQATVALSRTEDGIAWALGDSKFAGAALLDTSVRRPICRATHVTLGRIVDLAIKDMNNMGAAMAPDDVQLTQYILNL